MIGLTHVIEVRRSEAALYFVRHGETLANSTGKYNAHTINSFSPRGKAEIQLLTQQLRRLPPFELILVSPSERALRTIAPYLRETGQKATIWPLLYECCTGRRPANAHPTRFSYGASVPVPRDLVGLFFIMKSEPRVPVAPDYNAGLAQVNQCVAEFNRFFRGKRVLLVGHSGEGGHLIHDLTGRWIKLENAKLETLKLP